MRPVRQFTVVSNVPESLREIESVAANLHWAWDRQLAVLFDRLDGTRDDRSWRDSGQHPVDLVHRTSAACWEALADDQGFVDELAQAKQRLDDVLGGSSWFSPAHADGDTALESVAYFSPEFGITEALPQYSGGLGVLAGDHLKASSDLGVPLVGVGLLYAEGYFRQWLDDDGWQQRAQRTHRPDALGLAPHGRRGRRRPRGCRRHRAGVARGRRPDPAVSARHRTSPRNPPEAIAVTDRLYGGDEQHRLRQEIVLGIGGVRALRALGIQPQVFHTNEGHAGFLGLERCASGSQQGLDASPRRSRQSAPAAVHDAHAGARGHRPLPRRLIETVLRRLRRAVRRRLRRAVALGQSADERRQVQHGRDGPAPRRATRTAWLALHGEVSREMFGGLWPDLPARRGSDRSHHERRPRPHLGQRPQSTNCSSSRSARSGTSADGAGLGARCDDIDQREIWAVRERRDAENSSTWSRDRSVATLLDPDVLTIGFARRFATYKRATLLLSQLERLRALLLDADRPVQFVFAGKAHPADEPGKEMIQRDRSARPRRRRRPSVRVHPRLRHRHRPHDVPRLRRVAEHPAAPDGGVRARRG